MPPVHPTPFPFYRYAVCQKENGNSRRDSHQTKAKQTGTTAISRAFSTTQQLPAKIKEQKRTEKIFQLQPCSCNSHSCTLPWVKWRLSLPWRGLHIPKITFGFYEHNKDHPSASYRDWSGFGSGSSEKTSWSSKQVLDHSHIYWWSEDGWTGWSCGAFPTVVIMWFYDSASDWSLDLGLLSPVWMDVETELEPELI